MKRHVAGIAALLVALGAASEGATASVGAATHAHAAAPLPAGTEGPVGAIPWTRVGPGWLLGLWGPTPGRAAGPVAKGQLQPEKESTRLYLVDPAGGRYLVTTIPPPAFDSVVAWSGDGRRALLVTTSASGDEHVAQIDLATGRTSDRFVLREPLNNATFGYSRPQGLAVLVATAPTSSTSAGGLARYSPGGSLQLRFATSFPKAGAFGGSFLPSPDGSALVLGMSHGLAVVSNSGALEFSVDPAGGRSCSVLRWWARDVALATCAGLGNLSRLYEVPLHATSVPLTAAPKPPDYADLDAWRIGRHVFVQSAGACGYQFLSELAARGTTHKLSVPGVRNSSSVIVVGATSNRLALQATVACGTGQSLVWFDPAQKTSSVVLGPPLNGGGVIDALAYPTVPG